MKRILYVEDDLINALVMEKLFKDTFLITHVESGESCLETLARKSFDLVLMDINLGPGQMTGVDALRAIRSEPATAGIPVVAITAYAFSHDEERFLKEGFTGYIPKPLDWRALPEKIDQYFAR
ncbi:response regulator [Parachryseolinea silvisoli]|jgi:two-component system cell cycle response regulator DivK|uniref:response regulator n=1 Tax=Parachryseolinea silvisoli TaxID=2873601 RepID=UPI002265C9CD|nr:response regulator [Parachryseolinea silvisoli]MCD9019605.1 response regulator [Parachryseolinea silvisoli]